VIRYCRAYDLATLLESPALSAAVPPGRTGVGYVWDDYTVTLNPFPDEESLIPAGDATWRRFCTDVLGHTAEPQPS
jgi:hypothetical protein